MAARANRATCAAFGHLWQSATFYVDRCIWCDSEESVFAPNHYQSPNRGTWEESA